MPSHIHWSTESVFANICVLSWSPSVHLDVSWVKSNSQGWCKALSAPVPASSLSFPSDNQPLWADGLFTPVPQHTMCPPQTILSKYKSHVKCTNSFAQLREVWCDHPHTAKTPTNRTHLSSHSLLTIPRSNHHLDLHHHQWLLPGLWFHMNAWSIGCSLGLSSSPWQNVRSTHAAAWMNSFPLYEHFSLGFFISCGPSGLFQIWGYDEWNCFEQSCVSLRGHTELHLDIHMAAFGFNRYFQRVFNNGCAILLYHWQCVRIQIPHILTNTWDHRF